MPWRDGQRSLLLFPLGLEAGLSQVRQITPEDIEFFLIGKSKLTMIY